MDAVSRRAIAIVGGIVVGLVACNALTGADDLVTEAVDSGEPEVVTQEGGGGSVDSGPPAVPDAQADASVEPDACAVQAASHVASVGPAEAAAFASTRPKTIDALLDDWDCQTPIPLDAAHGASVIFDAGAVDGIGAQVLLEWDPLHLYAAFVVTSPPPMGDDVEPFFNDAVELYLASTSPGVGFYRTTDAQLAVDHAGRAKLYRDDVGMSAAGVIAATRLTATGYVVEVQVAMSVLGIISASAGSRLGLDLAVDRGDGATQLGQLLWALVAPPACTCGMSCCCGKGANDLPYCDTLRFGAVELR
jgi:hypothetical protein